MWPSGCPERAELWKLLSLPGRQWLLVPWEMKLKLLKVVAGGQHPGFLHTPVRSCSLPHHSSLLLPTYGALTHSISPTWSPLQGHLIIPSLPLGLRISNTPSPDPRPTGTSILSSCLLALSLCVQCPSCPTRLLSASPECPANGHGPHMWPILHDHLSLMAI